MLNPRIALDQWRAFVAVVEAGDYAQAAANIHKTQSSVSYAVQKIEQRLRLKLFEKRGRSAVLTPAGQVLYRRAKNVLERATVLERGAACMGLGFAWFPEEAIRSDLASGTLKPLPMREGAERFSQLYLVFTDPDFRTPSAMRMAEIVREDVVELCPHP